MHYAIKTERLLLRDIRPADIEGMFSLDSDVDVHKYLGNKPVKTKSESEDIIKDIIKQYTDYGIGRWAVINKQTNEFMGWSGLKLNTKEPLNRFTNFYDIGYRLIKKYWGMGYATESSVAALQYGFNNLKLDTIYGITEINNEGSHQVLLKIGLQYIENFYYEKENLTLRWYNISKS